MAFSIFKKNGSEKGPQDRSIWNPLRSLSELEAIIDASDDIPQLVFKHSTRCGISRIVQRQFEKEWKGASPIHFLDLIAYREVSDQVAQRFGVHHESPQVIILAQGRSIHDASHQSISASVCWDIIQKVLNG